MGAPLNKMIDGAELLPVAITQQAQMMMQLAGTGSARKPTCVPVSRDLSPALLLRLELHHARRGNPHARNLVLRGVLVRGRRRVVDARSGRRRRLLRGTRLLGKRGRVQCRGLGCQQRGGGGERARDGGHGEVPSRGLRIVCERGARHAIARKVSERLDPCAAEGYEVALLEQAGVEHIRVVDEVLIETTWLIYHMPYTEMSIANYLQVLQGDGGACGRSRCSSEGFKQAVESVGP